MPSTLRWIFYLTLFLLIFFLLAYSALIIGAIYDPDAQRKQVLIQISTQIRGIGTEGWVFIRPFMQLIIVLIIVDWIVTKWGINIKSRIFDLDWNVQTLIALIIIGSFAIAALGGLGQYISTLEDLALVVVGFYFGSQKKLIEVKTEGEKTTIVEEHTNDVTMKKEEEKNKG